MKLLPMHHNCRREGVFMGWSVDAILAVADVMVADTLLIAVVILRRYVDGTLQSVPPVDHVVNISIVDVSEIGDADCSHRKPRLLMYAGICLQCDDIA